MRRVFYLHLSLILLAFFTISPFKAEAVSKADFVHATAVQNAGNSIYQIYVADGAPGFGTYTVATGPSHPATIAMGVPQDILYEGAAGDPWSTYLTVRSYTTDTEYTSAPSSPSPSAGFSQADLDTYKGSTTTNATSIISTWDVSNVVGDSTDDFTISQAVMVEGTTLDDSRVRVTTTINNTGDESLILGIRYEWDLMIDGEDGSYIKTVDPYSGWYSTEQETSSPSMQQFQAVNDPLSPIFYVNGSINGPAFSPAPTPPSLIQFDDWGDVDGAAFDYTPTGQTIAGPSYDSAVAYFWGDNIGNAITLGADESTTVTQYLFAPMQESNPSSPSVAVLPQTGSE